LKRLRSNATVNRTLALVRAILRRCHREWEWLGRIPAVRLLKEPTRRIRFLTRPEAAALLRELPQHQRDMATFALSTEHSAGNITGLCWDQVDMALKRAGIENFRRHYLRHTWASWHLQDRDP
jgi:integrase